jgi:hypothetical protein
MHPMHGWMLVPYVGKAYSHVTSLPRFQSLHCLLNLQTIQNSAKRDKHRIILHLPVSVASIPICEQHRLFDGFESVFVAGRAR